MLRRELRLLLLWLSWVTDDNYSHGGNIWTFSSKPRLEFLTRLLLPYPPSWPFLKKGSLVPEGPAAMQEEVSD